MPVDNYIRNDNIASSKSFAAITPHDTTELATIPKGIYVGGAGNVVVIGADDSTAVTFTGVPAGSVLPVRPRIVKSTNTTATNLVALY